MLTLQILDGGETFYRPLDDRTLSIGSSTAADVCLTEGGVESVHARVEPIDGGDGAEPTRWKIVDVSESGTRVNGDEIAQWALTLGDRIEIGRAVLVVGKRVRRRATPQDVLAEEPVVSRTARAVHVRSGRARSRDGGGAWKAFVGAGVAGLVLVVGLMLWSGGSDALPPGFSDVARMRDTGRFDDARRLLDGFESNWAGVDGARLVKIAAARDRLARVERRVVEGRERIVAEAATKTRSEQLQELKARRAAAPDDPDGVAARILLSELYELRRSAPERGSTPVAESSSTEPSDRLATAGSGGGETATTEQASAPDGDDPTVDGAAAVSAAEVAARVEVIRGLHERGEFGHALEMLTQSLAETPVELASPLTALREDLAAGILTAQRAAVEASRSRAQGGDLAALDAAIADLERSATRFPTSGEFGLVIDEIARLRVRRAELRAAANTSSVAAALGAGVPEELGEILTQARAATRSGDFATAADAYARAATAVAELDPNQAARLRGKHDGLVMIGALTSWAHDHVEQVGSVHLRTYDGRPVELAMREAKLEFIGGLDSVGWLDLSPRAVRDVLLTKDAPTPAMLGFAEFAYRQGERQLAESVLVDVVRREPSHQEDVDALIARGRDEVSQPYQLVRGEFVAVRMLEAAKLAKKLQSDLRRVLARDVAQREAWLEEKLAAGPDELDAVLLALRGELVAVEEKVAKHAFRKHWEKLRDLRVELDEARQFAKALIYDEERYFYPYKPPAVSGDKASEYWKVQSEVDDRVAAVRKLWEARSPKKKAPSKLVADVERLDWLAETLRGFGESVSETEDVAWTRSLPAAGAALELQNFCLTPREREHMELWARVDLHNGDQGEHLTKAESAQVEITNAYRRMFAHRPLAVNLKLLEATRGHAEEMSRLGYFSHFSPTAGRRTPFDRMKLAGYGGGASENIARHGSARSAHEGWIRSSGHHRNLLMPSHEEFAVGNTGNYWVQNFGRSGEYRQSERFADLVIEDR